MDPTESTSATQTPPAGNGAPPQPAPDSGAAAANLASIQQELDAALAKSNEYLEGWQRALAEFSNYKKRVERDREQTQQNLTAVVIRRYLEVLDDLERALKNRPQEGDGAAWAGGVELIYRKFIGFLDAEGVRQMEALGLPFDPTRHEAILQEPVDGVESGRIIEVIQNGYTIGERVLRPALVRIAA